MPTVDASLMTAVPIRGTALRLRTRHQGDLRRSFSALLDAVCSDDLDELEAARSWARALDVDRAFAPWVHAHHFALQSAIGHGDGPKARRILLRLGDHPSHEDYCDHLVLDGLPEDHYERDVLYTALESNHYRETLTDERGPCSLEGSEATYHAQLVHQALDQLRELDPLMMDEVDALVTHISVVDRSPAVSMTDMQSFGRLYIHRARDPDPASFYLDSIVHETSHLRLHALMAIDPLVTNPPEERFEAPFRLDLRPMTGILHATFVLSRLVRLWTLASRCDRRSSERSERLRSSKKRFEHGLRVIDDHASLTPLGTAVVHSLRTAAHVESLAPPRTDRDERPLSP